MEIDIRTLVIVLGFTHLMQVLVFYHQYRVNKTYRGIGWWLLWSTAEVIGFGCMLLRGIPSLLPIIIIVQNSMIVVGTVFLYIGVKHFFNKTVNLKLLLPLLAAFIIGLLFFLFIKNDIQMRSILISASLAFISFITAYSLYTEKNKSINAASNFNAGIFLVHGGVFTYRLIMIIAGTPMDNVFSTDFINLLTYFDALIVSLLWTFGLIIMLNQRLNFDIQETKNKLQLIFNSSPDALVIRRLADGLIIDVNEGYTAITGYSRDEMIGKLTSEINIWKNNEDRQKVNTLLKEQGYCENYEATFLLKNGAEINGLISAKTINIQGSPHVISITRNITDRKKMDLEMRESELLFRLLFENMSDGVALHEIIYDEKGLPVNYRIIDVNNAFEKHTGIAVNKAKKTLATQLYDVTTPPYFAEYCEVAHSGKSISFETHFPILNKDFSISAISTKPGYFATIFQDITERKQKEAETQILLEKSERSRINLLSILEDQMIAQESLKVSEERYRSLLTNLEAGVVVHAPNTAIIMSNRRASVLLGLGDDQIKGKLATDPHWKFISENNKPLPIEEYPINRIIATKKSINNFILGVVLPKTDEITWLTVNGFPVMDSNDKITEILISFIEITERKKAEETLRQSEDKFKYLFDYSVLGKSITFPTGEIHVNKAFCDITGYSFEELQTKTWREITHPEDIKLNEEMVDSLLSGEKESARFTKRYIHKNGSVVWADVATSLRRDNNGKPLYFMTVINDITERKKSETQLNLSSKILSILNEPLDLALTIPRVLIEIKETLEFDAIGFRLKNNEDFPYFNQVGFTNEFISHENSLIAHSDNGTICRDKNGNISLECTCGLIVSGKTDPENPLFTIGGSAWTNDSLPSLDVPKAQDPRLNPRNRCIHEGYLSIALVPIRVNNEIVGILQFNDRKKNRLTLEMVHFLEGISTFISMALLRKKQTEALQFKNLAFDASLAANSIADLSGTITEVNEAFLRIWGYSFKEEVIGRQISEFIDDKEDTKKMSSALQRNGQWEGNYTAKRKNGSTFIAYSVATAVKNENGSNIGYQSAVLDVTEEKRAEAEIKKLNEELEQRVIQRTTQLEAANKELEAFSYSVSHDLRAPLRHVNGYVELLNKHFNSVLPEKAQHYLNSITNSVHSMGNLIDDLLQFSRMGRKDMLQTELNMGEIIQEVKESICLGITNRKIEWQLGKMPKVHGDRAMLQLVWINLINNAIKFTSTRKKAKIEIDVIDEKNQWVFFIKDNGVGFDMQYAHKLFGVFQRLHPSDEFEGTGIGLANVQRIVLRHGGRAWAEGEIDKGAKIYFSIPK